MNALDLEARRAVVRAHDHRDAPFLMIDRGPGHRNDPPRRVLPYVLVLVLAPTHAHEVVRRPDHSLPVAMGAAAILRIADRGRGRGHGAEAIREARAEGAVPQLLEVPR